MTVLQNKGLNNFPVFRYYLSDLDTVRTGCKIAFIKIKFIGERMMPKFFQMALLCCLLTIAQPALTQEKSQSNELSAKFKRLTPEEEVKLRAILAEPVPTGALNLTLLRHFEAKKVAIDRLGEAGPKEVFYRQWVAAMPDESTPLNNLSVVLQTKGDFDEAIQLNKMLLEKTKPGIMKEFYRGNLASKYNSSMRYEDAQKTLDVVVNNLKGLKQSGQQVYDQISWLRAQGQASYIQYQLHSRYGRWNQAIESASANVEESRQALKLADGLPNNAYKNSWIRSTVSDFGSALGKKEGAFRRASRFGEAEETLREYIRLSQERELPPLSLSGLNQISGALRMDQREFVVAEDYFRKAEKVYASLGYGELAPYRTELYGDIIATLDGQHRWDDALKELSRLDDLAGTDPVLKERVKFLFERGYAYLGSGKRLTEAANLFFDLSNSVGKRYPESHFFVAQANGLQAVAMWRIGDAASKAKALPMLKASVQNYMLPDNFEMQTVGLRKEVRQLIFSTYLEATFTSRDAQAIDAMASADWVRGGMVQEALADAALRSAVSDPSLSTLVRSDQDQKNEIEALRKFLAGDAGGSRTPVPEIATKMYARIAALEASRRKVLIELKAQFPDYDRLVRPAPPSAADIKQTLTTDEALVMLIPTDDAVYVWGVTSDGKDASARVVLPKVQLAKLIRDLRMTLDFGEMGANIRPFNAVASGDLYQLLLKPVEAAFAGKKHLIVAAGGALGQIPFGILLTQPVKKVDTTSPWLIKQSAITHIPSLSAWLAVKQFAKTKSAPEPFEAWGDPQFSSKIQMAKADATIAVTRRVVLTRATTVVDLDKEDPRGAVRYSDIPALPETRDELMAIANILKADTKNSLHFGDGASKASVLKSNKDGELLKKKVIAFATHGLMAGDLPHLTQPALALASTGNEDKEPLGALLTLDEVLNLKLNADWVILSACNTAAADGKADEALSGLARGFFYAGSRSLLVTHWSVESESAKQLTTNTMAHYIANPTARKAESLRQSMLSLMTNPQYQHPAYWAPYALVGDGGR
jgi:CHAT domain-containing protein/tetratricopeptide (TPR) repeat protein